MQPRSPVAGVVDRSSLVEGDPAGSRVGLGCCFGCSSLGSGEGCRDRRRRGFEPGTEEVRPEVVVSEWTECRNIDPGGKDEEHLLVCSTFLLKCGGLRKG